MFILEDPTHTEWTKWDLRLAKAFELNADLISGGVPIYWDRSDRVRFEAGSYISKSRAAVDRAEEKQSKAKTKVYGKVFYPKPVTVDGGPLPTLEEFLEQEKGKANRDNGLNKWAMSGSPDVNNANWRPEGE